MAVTNEGWYAGNATRSWPLDDAATVTDDSGQLLPPGILVDANVRFPEALGSYLFLSGVTVTPNLVTLLFSVSPSPALPGTVDTHLFTPAAALSVPQPAYPGKMYALTPLVDGVAGWVVLGDAIDTPYTGRFSTVKQGQIVASVAGPYPPAHVTSLGREGTGEAMTGIVTLKTGQDLTLRTGPATIAALPGSNGVPVTVPNAIFIGLADTLGRNTLALYAAGQARPESGTCPKPPLQSIAGVMPDCTGLLTLQLRGLTLRPFDNGHGAVLELARGLSATCPGQALPDPAGRVAGVGTDLCAPGIIPTTTIDATTCNAGPPALPPPTTPPPTPAQVPTKATDTCIRIYDDFRSIPFAAGGTWSSSANAAVGPWTAGVETTPSVLYYTGGNNMLTKIASGGGVVSVDTFIRHPPCPDDIDTVLDWLAFTLVRPHAGFKAGAGIAVNVRPDGSYYQATWDVLNAKLAIDHIVGGQLSARLASTPLDPAVYGADTWAQLAVNVTTSIGTLNIEATLTPAADAFTPPAVRRDVIVGVAIDPAVFGKSPTSARYLPDGPFGLATLGGAASFAYFYAHVAGTT